MAACTDAQPEDSDRDDLDRWRRAWSIVVRRDILRQQRALVTQQREIFVTQKRSALAVQKEVRKRALRAQRVASNPQVQVRCKRIARDILTLAPAIETKLNARRASAELVGHMVSAIHCQGVRSADLTRMSAPRVAPLAGASSTRIGLGTIAPPALADRALLAATTESLATSVANAASTTKELCILSMLMHAKDVRSSLAPRHDMPVGALMSSMHDVEGSARLQLQLWLLRAARAAGEGHLWEGQEPSALGCCPFSMQPACDCYPASATAPRSAESGAVVALSEVTPALDALAWELPGTVTTMASEARMALVAESRQAPLVRTAIAAVCWGNLHHETKSPKTKWSGATSPCARLVPLSDEGSTTVSTVAASGCAVVDVTDSCVQVPLHCGGAISKLAGAGASAGADSSSLLCVAPRAVTRRWCDAP